ncbi:Helix-turn-helix domain-containing protein [Streptomyces zhaozhouensis]|uniref:Helix-turn-helix domain-containing protein n=1 Tax=Streptomyces zhaozhouensis TaxID=1300267 RepID=A0A286E0S0_9ACTN|nr:helix-turn-helix transcriptional regulator [Streptomyces zhaozhouensis]SOD64475.1 Helix-turn-helix domain-containing protein [Streptomyces zhaozhouensis]
MAKKQVNGDEAGKLGSGLNDLVFLGSEIKAGRLGRSLTQEHLAKATGYSLSYVSKVESGLIVPSQRFVEGCDLALGTDGLYARLRARVVNTGLPAWFQPFVQQERKARWITEYSLTLVPGLLQTGDYARAVFEAWAPDATAEEIAQQVKARLERQQVLAGETPASFWAILHECCLRIPVGGPAVMRDQLAHLVTMAALPQVTLQVLPIELGAPPSTDPMIVLRQSDGQECLYSDTVMGGQLSNDEARLSDAARRIERLKADALAPRRSIVLLNQLAEGFHE